MFGSISAEDHRHPSSPWCFWTEVWSISTLGAPLALVKLCPAFCYSMNWILFTYKGPNQLQPMAVISGMREGTPTSEKALPKRISLALSLWSSITVTQIVIILILWIIFSLGQLGPATLRGLRGYREHPLLSKRAFQLSTTNNTREKSQHRRGVLKAWVLVKPKFYYIEWNRHWLKWKDASKAVVLFFFGMEDCGPNVNMACGPKTLDWTMI